MSSAALEDPKQVGERLSEEGWRLFKDAKFTKAELHFSSALVLLPDNARLWCNRGVCHYKLGENEKVPPRVLPRLFFLSSPMRVAGCARCREVSGAGSVHV